MSTEAGPPGSQPTGCCHGPYSGLIGDGQCIRQRGLSSRALDPETGGSQGAQEGVSRRGCWPLNPAGAPRVAAGDALRLLSRPAL